MEKQNNDINNIKCNFKQTKNQRNPIEVDNENEILFDIIKECHLNFEKLIKYAEKQIIKRH